MSSEEQFGEKILGVGIGRRGKPRLRRGRPDVPHDGDGDGFYSPRPGMPDKTPVPVRAIVELGEDAFAGTTESERAMNIASAAAKKIEESVTKKHGPLKTTKDAQKALLKAFPNLTWDSGQERDLTPPERNMVVGLLHAADTKPKAAKRLNKLQFYERGMTAGGSFGLQYAVYRNGEVKLGETVMKFNTGLRVQYLPSNFGQGPNSPWAYALAGEMKRSGKYSDEDIERVLHQNIALHEFGHMAHFDAGATHWGIDPEDPSLSPELLRAGLVEALARSVGRGGGVTPEMRTQIEDTLEATSQRLRRENPNASPFEIEEALRQTAIDVNPSIDRLWSAGFEDAMLWDGVEQEKRKRIREELAKVSRYARAGFDDDPWTQYSEGVAEAFARRESMAGTGYESLGRQAETHLRYVLTKDAKKANSAGIEETLDSQLCSGFLKVDKDGKFVPIPSPEPIDVTPMDLDEIKKAFGYKGLEDQLDEKILGLGIGKRGKRRLRRGGPDLPHDGDGDGFYSPGPGMPDKTPVPKIPMVNLGGDPLNNLPADGIARESRIASEAAKKIEQGVISRHGNIRNRATAKAALAKVFPNADHGSLIRGRGGDLSDTEFNYTVGLLHLADTKPRAAKRIKEIKRFKDVSDEGGKMNPMFDRDERFTGIALHLNINCKAESMQSDQMHDQVPYAFEVAMKMRDSGYSIEDQNRVLQQGIAMHEMAHAIHFEYGLNWNGVKDGEHLPAETWEGGFVEATKGLTDMTPIQIQTLWSNSLAFERALNGNVDPNSELIYKNAVRRASEEVADRYMMDREQWEFYVNSVILTKFSEVAWDGVEKAKRNQIRRELRKVSGYARAGHDIAPGVQYFEGVAEAISAREHTTNLDDRTDFAGIVGDHLEDVATKVEKGTSDMDKPEYDFDKIYNDPDSRKSCRGYGPKPMKQVKPLGKPRKSFEESLKDLTNKK